MINNLQLVGHTPMLKVTFPPNSKIAFEYLIKVVTFDPVTDDARVAVK